MHLLRNFIVILGILLAARLASAQGFGPRMSTSTGQWKGAMSKHSSSRGKPAHAIPDEL